MAENIDYGVDPELVMEFVDESQEMLSEVANMFITLESDPSNKEAIDKIFRTVHTIKGNSAFFNLMKVKSLAHIMEDLMNLVREGSMKFSEAISGVLIRGIDFLKDMLENVRAGKPELEDDSEYNVLIDEITGHVEGGKKKDPVAIWKQIKKDLQQFKENLVLDDSSLKGIWERILQNLDLVSPIPDSASGEVSSPADSGEGMSSSKAKDIIETLKDILSADFGETLDEESSKKIFSALEELKKQATEETVSFVDEAIDAYNKTVPSEGFTSFLAEVILSKINNVKIKEKLPKEQEGPKSAAVKDKDSSVRAKKTMRVYESSIDRFLDFVGELVVVGEMYDHIQKRFAEKLGLNKDVINLKKNNETFNDLSTALQKSVLDIRRVPIKTLVQRAPRIVHDVAVAKKKKIKVHIIGEETLIDKSLLESLEGPFVHMVRNAADHGIESPEERKAKGKPEEGNITIEITENETSLFISIKDDGGGINRDVVIEKAISKGLLTKERAVTLSEQEVYHLLFAPGFSTAKEITDISGRGVGMDVVKKNVDAMGGQIHISSVVDEGSTFTIEAPKAVAVRIMAGFLVSSCDNRFVLPMSGVGESFMVNSDEITTTIEEGECLLHHKKVFPVIRLDRLLELKRDETDKRTEYVGVIITAGQRDFVLLVDDVLGTQQVVIKDIEGLGTRSDLISGGAILGDERVAIVLNLENVL